MSSILLLENHAGTRAYLAEVLRSSGHAVRVAGESGEAWELFADGLPDILIVSLHDADAAAFVGRAREASPTVPVIAFDHAHLGKALGKDASMRLRPDAYVADISQPELLEQVALLAARITATDQAAPSGAAVLLARPPALHGQLRDLTLATTLLMLWRTFRDGVLVVQQGEVERKVYLKLGVPVSFESTERGEALDRWLLETGRITEAQLGEALAERAGGALSAAASLVAAGALEPGPPLVEVLRAHLSAMLCRVVGLRHGRFRFHAGPEYFDGVQPVEVPAAAHLLVGTRAHLPLRTFVAALLPDRARFPRRTESFAELVPHMALGPKDLRVALELNGALSVESILHARRHPLREVASLLWFLRLVDAVSFAPQATKVDADTSIHVPEEKLKPLGAELLAEIRESALSVLPSTYFHALGVDIAAGAEEVERAYLQVTENLHPDRFAGFDLSEVEDLLGQVQDKLAAAHRTLSAPEKRAGYLEHLFSRAPHLRGGRPLQVEAEVAMVEAVRALREKRAEAALERARQAVALAPREPDFLSHLAILELLHRGRADADRLGQARKAARKALAIDPESARAIFALALVARDEGDLAEARKQVLAALKLRPRMELARWLLRELNRVP